MHHNKNHPFASFLMLAKGGQLFQLTNLLNTPFHAFTIPTFFPHTPHQLPIASAASFLLLRQTQVIKPLHTPPPFFFLLVVITVEFPMVWAPKLWWSIKDDVSPSPWLPSQNCRTLPDRSLNGWAFEHYFRCIQSNKSLISLVRCLSSLLSFCYLNSEIPRKESQHENEPSNQVQRTDIVKWGNCGVVFRLDLFFWISWIGSGLSSFFTTKLCKTGNHCSAKPARDDR